MRVQVDMLTDYPDKSAKISGYLNTHDNTKEGKARAALKAKQCQEAIACKKGESHWVSESQAKAWEKAGISKVSKSQKPTR